MAIWVLAVEKRPEHEGREVIWQIAARRSTYQKLGKRSAYKTKRKIEIAKAQVKAKVEYPFRVIKRLANNWLRCLYCRICGWPADIY
ncbi:hypothetical protein J3D48_004371 [Pseudomonas fluorescens]|nr:hypothetical protein [Pseudomonas fluorescens]MCP1488058.1 hypothetical protein [Pseudomonas fluorescens]